MSGQVVESCTACLRVRSASIRISAAFLRSASESMVGPSRLVEAPTIAGFHAADEVVARMAKMTHKRPRTG